MKPRRAAGAAVLCALALMAGCAAAPGAGAPGEAPEGWAYVAQAVRGHWALMHSARPLAEGLADPSTPPELKTRLATVQRMRRFAVDELGLPDNASYTRYADLQGRRAVVWNVVAAPEFSLRLHTWCFPVLGCVGYRGYFDETHAQALARRLRVQGLDAAVYPVPAYSTLGWTNWLGGDPVPSTLLTYPEGELARLLFHELAHQVIHVADDTAFNESWATAVERLGVARWLETRADATARETSARFDERRRAFRALTAETRQNLKQIYDSALDGQGFVAPEKEEYLRQQKAQVLVQFRQRHAQLKAVWGGYSGYDAWVAQANNALLALQGAYDDHVPAFLALFERLGRSWPRFYDEAQRLARLPPTERTAALNALRPHPPATP